MTHLAVVAEGLRGRVGELAGGAAIAGREARLGGEAAGQAAVTNTTRSVGFQVASEPQSTGARRESALRTHSAHARSGEGGQRKLQSEANCLLDACAELAGLREAAPRAGRAGLLPAAALEAPSVARSEP